MGDGDGGGDGGAVQRLLLYFDVNKNIIFKDPAGGKELRDILCGVMMERVFGHLSHDAKGAPVFTPVETDARTCTTAPEGTLSYRDFMEEHLAPFAAPSSGAAVDAQRAAAVNEANLRVRRQRTALTKAFTDDGQAGAHVRGVVQDMLAAMETHYFVPSFLHAMHVLCTSRAYDVRVCFRTLGRDLPDVIREWNAFCEGATQGFADTRLDGTREGVPDMRIHGAAQHAVFFRCGAASDDTYLAVGTLERTTFERGAEHYAALPGVRVLRGFAAAHEWLCDDTHRALAVQDYFPWWNACGEAFNSGKVMTLGAETLDTVVHGKEHVLPIFFDDNIDETAEWGRATNILDIRRADTGESVYCDTVAGVHAVRSEGYHVITQRRYWLDIIERAAASFFGDK